MESSLTLRLLFIAMPLILIVVATWLSKSKTFLTGAATILLLSGLLAGAGVFSNFEALPPRLVLLLFPLSILVTVSAFRPVGDTFRDLRWEWLVGFQAFRLPLELMIFLAVAEGVAPPQFTWTGLNFDIASGIISLVLMPFASQVPKWALWTWSAIGLGLLINIVTVAILSVPGPLQVLRPDNTWVAYFPFIWLPTICVMAALFGHLVAIRKLLQKTEIESKEQSDGSIH